MMKTPYGRVDVSMKDGASRLEDFIISNVDYNRSVSEPISSKMRRTSVVSMGTKSTNRQSISYPSRSRSNTWTGEQAKYFTAINRRSNDFTRPPINFKGNSTKRCQDVILEHATTSTRTSSPLLLSPLLLSPSAATTTTTTTINNENYVKLNEDIVKEIITEILHTNLEGVSYDHKKCKNKSSELSCEIHDRLKNLSQNNYKITVLIYLGEIRDEGIEVSSQCIWDSKCDCVVISCFKNETLFAIASVFASHLD
ncbi:uncharacterized protein LOC130655917 [Hydractinia symbiolongicarpus]|uniref:uncharacterized protein LOC130655917 n=1 Tax=Hydractinia symbiolongicarpus TaxID=13093 RepID=UPI002551C47B|nr:uncharacterized protein LOC130655917 [Hydractinia symbiolongicarpus]XP_057314715.1 uncharacterized protein LOC130655917 [Hydractinia symbiolongicarpus]